MTKKSKMQTVKAILVIDDKGNYGIGGSSRDAEMHMDDAYQFIEDWNLTEDVWSGHKQIFTVEIEAPIPIPPTLRILKLKTVEILDDGTL